MPRLKLKYKLNVSRFHKLEKLVFANREIPFKDDVDPNDSTIFRKEDSTYYVFPDDDHLKIFVLVNSTSVNAEWSLDIWINDKKITQQPIKVKANNAGRADYDDKIKWFNN